METLDTPAAQAAVMIKMAVGEATSAAADAKRAGSTEEALRWRAALQLLEAACWLVHPRMSTYVRRLAPDEHTGRVQMATHVLTCESDVAELLGLRGSPTTSTMCITVGQPS